MGEFEPQQQGFFFEVDGRYIEATPENTTILFHQEASDAKYDFVASMYEDEEGDTCLHINWRGDLPNESEEFDKTAHDMTEAGFEPKLAPIVNESVRELYDKHHPPVESFYSELTPRQELRPRFLSYLLHHGHLTPDDFQYDGELFL